MRIHPFAALRTESAALLHWWVRELRDMGQQLLMRTAPRFGKHLIIEFKGNAAEAYFLRRGSPSERFTISANPSAAWPMRLPANGTLAECHGARATLVLAPEDIFRFDLCVPGALHRDLDSAIELHLERALPLPRDQFGVCYQVRKHLPTTGRIRVLVLVVHRSQLDHLRDLAQQWELRLTRIGAPGDPSDPGAVLGNFLRTPFRFRAIRLTLLERRFAAAVSVLAVTLGSLIVGQWMYERVVVGAQLRTIDSQAQVASRLAHRLMHDSAPARELIKIARVPDASDVLATLTRTVPSYAWVYQLRIEAPSTGDIAIRMGAFAPPSTTLVSILERAHQFGTVQLISATSQGGPSGLERLKLTASRSTVSKRTAIQDKLIDASAPQ